MCGLVLKTMSDLSEICRTSRNFFLFLDYIISDHLIIKISWLKDAANTHTHMQTHIHVDYTLHDDINKLLSDV